MPDDNERSTNGWTEWGKFVLKELERLNKVIADLISSYNNELKAIRKEMKERDEEIVGLKIKSGVWGLIGGLIPVLIVLILFWMNFQAADRRYANSMNEILNKIESKYHIEETVTKDPQGTRTMVDIYKGGK